MPDNKVLALPVAPRHVYDCLVQVIETAYTSHLVLQGQIVDIHPHCVIMHDQHLRVLVNRYWQGFQLGIYPSSGSEKPWWPAICCNRDDLPRFFEDQRHNLPLCLVAKGLDVQTLIEAPPMILLVHAQMTLYRKWFGEVPGVSNPFQPAVREASITPLNARRLCE